MTLFNPTVQKAIDQVTRDGLTQVVILASEGMVKFVCVARNAGVIDVQHYPLVSSGSARTLGEAFLAAANVAEGKGTPQERAFFTGVGVSQRFIDPNAGPNDANEPIRSSGGRGRST